MNAREELYEAVLAIMDRDLGILVNQSDLESTADATTDALIAAGYVKPCTITTVEELDALGRLSTVLADNGCVWINDGDAADQWASLVEFDPIWRASADVELPATVLYEPEAQS